METDTQSVFETEALEKDPFNVFQDDEEEELEELENTLRDDDGDDDNY